MSENLQKIIDRVKAGTHTPEDIRAIVSEISGGKLVLASGSGAVAIGGDASNAPIVTGKQNIIGDRNTVIYIYGTDSEVIQSVVDRYSAIDNTFQRSFPPSASLGVDWDWGMKLLKQKQLPEIRKRLTDTLGRDSLSERLRQRILMDVSIEEQQNWVNRSPLAADRTLQINGEDCGTLDANKMLIETFGRDDIEGKLLILGAPGAGKTTALLSLAEQLVYGAISQPRTVIPVFIRFANSGLSKPSKASRVMGGNSDYSIAIIPIMALTMSIIFGMKQDLKIRSRPNEGIFNSFKSMFFSSSLSYLMSIVFSSLYIIQLPLKTAIIESKSSIVLWQLVQVSLTKALGQSLIIALFFGFAFGGGMACIQHVSTRLVMCKASILPWDMARFLKYCEERKLIHSIGGRYRFLHRELLDHFARSSR
jgi:Effector-associated domain 10